MRDINTNVDLSVKDEKSKEDDQLDIMSDLSNHHTADNLVSSTVRSFEIVWTEKRGD